MVTDTKRVRMSMATPGRSEIVVDGVDIANLCMGASLTVPVHDVPTLRLEIMAFGDYEIEEAQIRYVAAAWGKSGEGRTPVEAVRSLLEALGG